MMQVGLYRCLSIAAAAFVFSLSAMAQATHDHAKHGHDHSAHGTQIKASGEILRQSHVEVSLPALKIVRHDGQRQELREVIGRGQPVFVNFIFTSCTSVCPIMSETFASLAEMQPKSGPVARIISISIDPEVDTPERLRDYAAQFGSPPAWQLFTGTADDSRQAQKAFGLDIRDKMSHPVATFYNSGKGNIWLRLDGFATPYDLAARAQIAAKRHHQH